MKMPRSSVLFFRREKGPKRDIVVLNAALAIRAGQKAEDMNEAIKLAETSIDSGAAIEKMEQLVKVTNQG